MNRKLTRDAAPGAHCNIQSSAQQLATLELASELGSTSLRHLALASQQGCEDEKRRLSKELHDDLAQGLSVLKLDLGWLEKNLAHAHQCVPERIGQMHLLLDKIIIRTKSIATTLRPPLLDDFGLMPAVQWVTDNFQKRTGIICRVDTSGVDTSGVATPGVDTSGVATPGVAASGVAASAVAASNVAASGTTASGVANSGIDIAPGDPAESAIFRVIQEGLLNIERHARARHVLLRLRHHAQQVDLLLQDDGVGIDVGGGCKDGCYGLIAMRERITILDGTIRMGNAIGGGFVIHAVIPLRADQSPVSPP